VSFDIFLFKCERGEMAPADRDGVRAILDTIKAPIVYGAYSIDTEDLGHASLYAQGLDGNGDFTNCAFITHGLSPQLLTIVFDVAQAGDMIIVPAMEPFAVILSSEGQRAHLPEDLAKETIVLCTSASQLEALVQEGYDGWLRYRDQVIGDAQTRPN